MTAFGRNLKAIPLNHQPAHLKFIHNQLPLGDQLYQRSPVKDPHLKLCPLCKELEENIHHFLHCHNNPNREKSIKLMVKTIPKDNHPSRAAFASCLEQYLQSPGQPIQFHNEKFHGHLYETLHEAIEEQTLLGWHHLLLGYTSKKWLLLASMGTPKFGQIILSAGRSRTQVAIGAITRLVRDLRLGQNEILHQHQDDKDKTIYYSMESAELRHYHSNPNLVPTSKAGPQFDDVGSNASKRQTPNMALQVECRRQQALI
ncbi:hypothetical protein MHU86_19716 [Fragilaria crotonensis]|nr:hypothetical protein MHU86_19716 [Fragilaria crotonensis]